MPGPSEMAIILVLILILFGAGKLPEVFGQFGQGVKAFRSAQKEVDGDDAETVAAAPKPADTRRA